MVWGCRKQPVALLCELLGGSKPSTQPDSIICKQYLERRTFHGCFQLGFVQWRWPEFMSAGTWLCGLWLLTFKVAGRRLAFIQLWRAALTSEGVLLMSLLTSSCCFNSLVSTVSASFPKHHSSSELSHTCISLSIILLLCLSRPLVFSVSAASLLCAHRLDAISMQIESKT